jgi:hypothetical protein
MCKYLHVYGQRAWHDTVILVADHKALEALKASVEVALSGEIGVCEFFTDDGEGFDLIIKPVAPKGYMVPYTAEYAQDIGSKVLNPFIDKEISEICKQKRKKKNKND